MDSRTNDLVTFAPVKRVPGFTHRVIVNGKPISWLADTHRPSVKVAKYYLDKFKGGLLDASNVVRKDNSSDRKQNEMGDEADRMAEPESRDADPACSEVHGD